MTTNRIGTSSSYSFSMRLFLLICIPQTFWILICCSQGEFIVRLNSLFQVPETHVSILCIHPRKVRILSQKHADACLICKNRCHCNAELTCMHWRRKWDNVLARKFVVSAQKQVRLLSSIFSDGVSLTDNSFRHVRPSRTTTTRYPRGL